MGLIIITSKGIHLLKRPAHVRRVIAEDIAVGVIGDGEAPEESTAMLALIDEVDALDDILPSRPHEGQWPNRWTNKVNRYPHRFIDPLRDGVGEIERGRLTTSGHGDSIEPKKYRSQDGERLTIIEGLW